MRKTVQTIARILPVLAFGALIGATFQAHDMAHNDGSQIVMPHSSVPAWTHTLAVQFPNCRNIDNRPDSVIPNEVVLVPLDGGKAYREDFATAWANHTSGQFFTVGYCL